MNPAVNKYHRNNLDNSSSPYLVQHRDNPVWWQEWSSEVIDYARESEKPLFVSVGYSTCHWCHVMASEAFSDERTARYLNDYFVSVKVDREQRPDIDQFLMEFIQKQTGSGGWPLNVFLTPSLSPIFALTYAPVKQRGSMNTFLSVVQQVYSFYQKHKSEISSFEPVSEHPEISEDDHIISSLSGFYDSRNGGFGKGHKFPSHSTLLFLLYRFSVDKDQTIKDICYKTLEAMRLRGLNDHLQGGIFRYCVDPEWTIPHFEKMLYDQAMSLWVYSLAYRVFGREEYRSMAENFVRCLDESFSEDGFFISAHDADTDHQEGATYLWSYEELKQCLSEIEFSEFSQVYRISAEGNFEGKNHLLRQNDLPLTGLEAKLLTVRKSRKQPSRDNKILSGLNALTAIAFIQAGRAMEREDLKIRAGELVTGIINRFWDGKRLAHSLYNDKLQEQAFLSDASALFTAITFLLEEDVWWSSVLGTFEKYLLTFRRGDKWIESEADDFITIEASRFDHPVPSSVSMAEFGLFRAALLTAGDLEQKDYLQPYQHDFYNIAAMISRGLFHVITTDKLFAWNELPVNSLQVRGNILQDCYMGSCRLAEKGRLSFEE
jgi:uncharacterized protein